MNKCIQIHKKKWLKGCKTNLECRKEKCEANCGKNWAKWTKYASCTSRNVILGIFLTSSTMIRVKNAKECQKVKCKADCNKNLAKLIKYASCTSSVF